MTIGIEQFRNLTARSDIENRRVTVNQDTQELTAPTSLWGRFVNWVRGTENRGERGTLNQQAREAFYNALVKASNPEFAEKVIKRVYGEQVTGETFKERTTNLQVSRVKQILDTARDMRRELRMDNELELEAFIENGNLGSIVETIARPVESRFGNTPPSLHPLLEKDDPDVLREFRKLVRMDPQYRQHTITRGDLDKIAAKAVDRALEVKKARFDEQYPELAKIDTRHFHDPETYFDLVGRDLGDQWMKDVLVNVRESSDVLGKMHFDRERAGNLLEDTKRVRDNLQQLRDEPRSETYQSAHDDLVVELAREALEGFPIEGPYKGYLEQFVEARLHESLSNLKEGESIEDETVRQRIVGSSCEELNEQLLMILAPSDLITEREKLQNRAQEVYRSNDLDRDDQLKELKKELDAIDDKILNNDRDRREKAVQDYRDNLLARLTGDPRVEALSQIGKTERVQYRMQRECDHQIAKLNAKIGFLEQYLNHDPRSERGLTYDRLIWAKATHSELTRIYDDIRQRRFDLMELSRRRNQGDLLTDEQNQQLQGLDGKLRRMGDVLESLRSSIKSTEDRIDELETAFLTPGRRRDDDSGEIQMIEEVGDSGREPESDPSQRRRQLKQNRTDEVKFLHDCLSEVQTLKLSRAGSMLDQARERVLSDPSRITPIQRDMVVTRDGVTRTYRSEIIPSQGSMLPNEQHELEEQAKENGWPETSFDVPDLQVSRLVHVVSSVDSEGDIKSEDLMKSEVIRHGVLDSWDIEDPDRRARVGEFQARQVVTVGVNLAPEGFLNEARRRSREDEPLNKLVHVSISLSTSDPSGRRLDRRDGDMIQHQIDAFGSVNGERALPVRFQDDGNFEPPSETDNSNDKDVGDGLITIDDDSDDKRTRGRPQVGIISISHEEEVRFDVDTISFSFAVSGKGTGARFDEHDRQNLIKLVGDLAPGSSPGGYVGGIVDNLQKRRAETTSERERERIDDLLGQIQREVDTARELFTTGAYKNTEVDPYKMARTVMRVVDLAGEGLRLSGSNDLHLSMSEGCRTNFSGGSKLDIEHKSQVIIEDMGGRMRPMQIDQSDENSEDRVILNTVLTSSGDSELRGQRTGHIGLGDMRDLSGRSRNVDVLDYTTGMPDPNRR